MEEDNEVYYRVYLDSNNAIVIVCLQWFDEHDYNQGRFLSEKKFTLMKEADVFIREIQNSARNFPKYIRKALDEYEGNEDIMWIFDKEA